MKRNERKDDFFQKTFVNPQIRQMNQLKMFRKKSLSDELFIHFFFGSSESDRVSNFLHDSNSIFRAAGINSGIFFGRTELHFISCWFHQRSWFSQNHSEFDNELSTKALQDAVIHACVGVEVIPQGPPEGDHMANGRVEMVVREVKRQCRTLRISAEQNTSVRPLLSWFPRFAAQVMNKLRIGKDEMMRTDRRSSKQMAQFGESLVS